MIRSVLAMVVLVGLAAGLAQAGEVRLPELTLADATGLDAAQWGKNTVDERACQVLKAGVTGVLPMAVWWGNSLRPAEGTSYLANIVFKDTAAAPIKVETFAGLPGRYEIHRIGGLKDDQWKTAAVPIPWDLIMRLPGTDKTEIVFTAPAGQDIPFQKITLVPADPAKDEARWATETREWTARIQGAKRGTAKLPPAETAAIPDNLKEKKLIAFPRSSVHLIFPTSAPKEGEAGAPIKVKMALNEIEPAQFGVYANGADLRQVLISLKEALKDDKGEVLQAEIELLTAEYSVTRDGGLFPQRLWPAYPVDIAQGRSHLFWLNVATALPKSKAGVYKGKLGIEAQGLPGEEIGLEVEVVPLQLLTMKEAGLHVGGCVTGLLPAHELTNMVRQNHNSINLWFGSFAPKIVKKSATEFDLDFTIADDVMQHAREAGIENFVFFLGGDPYGFPDTCNLERELYRQVHSDNPNLMEGRKEFLRKVTAAPNNLLPELRPLYVQWVKKFMAHAKEKNWPEPLLTPFDEAAKWVQAGNSARHFYYRDKKTGREVIAHPRSNEVPNFLKKLEEDGNAPEDLGLGGAGAWIKPHFKESCAAIHEAWPEARIYASIHHAEPGLPFLPDVEVFCTNAIHEDAKLGDKVRAGGPKKVFWQYSGTGDNTEPASARYNFGFFFGAFDSRGSLCWAYNWGSRFDTSSGDQWLYAWTTPYGVVRAPFFEGMREAWDDRRYIETAKAVAKKAGRDKDATDLLEEIFNQAVKTRTAGGRDTVNDFWARTKDPEVLDTMRGKIRDLILKMK